MISLLQQMWALVIDKPHSVSAQHSVPVCLPQHQIVHHHKEELDEAAQL